MDTIIIGAGQAGLAASYYLKYFNIKHTILECNSTVGDQWRKRWDSLRLFTPARYNHLPGMPFPETSWSLPSKDAVADYLENYSHKFALPVECGIRVQSIKKIRDHFIVITDNEERRADRVIVATGAFQKPFIPASGKDFPESITQIHSSEYKNPTQLKPGATLVVGTGNSGVQIAEELSATHEVFLSGRDNTGFPRSFLGKDIYWWLENLGVLHATIESRLVKRLKKKQWGKGDPLVGRKMKQVVNRYDITRCAKVKGIESGKLLLEDDSQMALPNNVIWATGYRPDFSWITDLQIANDGYPKHERGVVLEMPGLYFLGLKLQYRVSSSLLGGVGRDAEYIAQQIASSESAK